MKILKRIITILIVAFILFTNDCYAQPQAYNWYFGYGAALNFSSGNPVSVAGSAIATNEGCATISDPVTGNLLFYTDGIKVWDKNNNQMPNGFGLHGDPSSTQSAVIVPHPDSANIYYIFAADYQANANGITYNEVDMTLNAGLGDVTLKNVQLVTPACEKICAVKHCNGLDYWVVVHGYPGNTYLAYLITPAGVQAPLTTNIGCNIQTDVACIGYLKASPNGRKLCAANSYSTDTAQLFDFDNSTGILSNVITIPFTSYGAYPYGVSFSPNNQVLYIAGEVSGTVYQYDISSNNQTTINASQYIAATGGQDGNMALQLASNGKIYVCEGGLGFLDAINNPNVLGAGCNYTANAVTLNTGHCGLGLPNFVDAWSVTPINTLAHDTTACPGPVVLNPDSGYVSYLWSTGATTQTISVSTSGIYWVRLTGVSTPCDTNPVTYDTINVTITTTLPVNLGPDESVCNNQSVTLNAGNPGDTYTWSTGATTQTITVNTPGTYYVQVSNGACIGRDTIVITQGVAPTVNLGPDSTICSNQSITLNAQNTGDTYTWSTGATTQTITANTTGTYWVNVSNGSCIGSDTVNITVVNIPTQNLGNDTSICAGTSLNLNAGNPGYNYQWSTGATTQTINVSSTGTYWVIVSQASCITPDSINVTVVPVPQVSIGPDSSVCAGQSITLNAENPGDTYLWSTGATTQTISVSNAGSYTVLVNNGTCTGIDTMVLTVLALPVVNIGPDTTICRGNSITLDAGNAGDTYNWSNGATTQTITVDSAGHYSVIVNNIKCSNTDTVNVNIEIPKVDSSSFTENNITGCLPLTVNFNNTSTNATSYLWLFGDGWIDSTKNPSHIFIDTGSFKVTLIIYNSDSICKMKPDTSIFDSITVHNCNIYIPNVFTPNGDGKNELFFIDASGYTNYNLTIYNRWGEKVFSSTDPKILWNGKLNNTGSEAPDGTYYYIFSSNDPTGKVYSTHGYLSLIR
jgi:gliding motility-associated-like protein